MRYGLGHTRMFGSSNTEVIIVLKTTSNWGSATLNVFWMLSFSASFSDLIGLDSTAADIAKSSGLEKSDF